MGHRGGPNAWALKVLGEFANDLGGEFILITAEPDKNAPKVTARNGKSVLDPAFRARARRSRPSPASFNSLRRRSLLKSTDITRSE